MIRISGFHHISAFTKSMEENIRFYTQVLGLRLVKQTVHQDNYSAPHLFYGDYRGNPGTLLTFFVYPKLGRSYLNGAYFSTISLSVPEGSLPYWNSRLQRLSVKFSWNSDQSELLFSDPDGLSLRLIEESQKIMPENATAHSDIPDQKQIIRIVQQTICVSHLDAELQFFKDWLELTDLPFFGYPPNQKLVMHQTTTSKPTRYGKGSIDHIAFSVKTIEDLNYFKTRAEKLGCTVEKTADRYYFTSLYVKSPSGLRIELATEAPGLAFDEPIETLGTQIQTLSHQ